MVKRDTPEAREYHREHEAAWRRTAKGKASGQEYRSRPHVKAKRTDATYLRERYQRRKELSPLKYKARKKFSNALFRGKLFRPTECSKCHKPCVPEGHHENYAEPLNVTWLCRQCHYEHHLNQREIKMVVKNREDRRG